jgi:hypothetical protein
MRKSVANSERYKSQIIERAKAILVVESRRRYRRDHLACSSRRLRGDNATITFTFFPVTRPREALGAITTGRKAMGHAELFPDPAKLKDKTDVSRGGFSKRSRAKARTVLAYPTELAPAVREGPVKFTPSVFRRSS